MNLRRTFLTISLVVISGVFGYWLGQQKVKLSFVNWKPAVILNKTPALSSGSRSVDFSLFWSVWDKLSTEYVDKQELDSKKMLDGAISGMVAAAGDPYTMYLPLQKNKENKEDLGGAFEGVGIQLGYKDKHLAVMTPLDGSPAIKAGVKSGDYILNIKDEKKKVDLNTDNMSTEEAVKYIRGDKGTIVVLTLFRQGTEKPFDVSLVRDTIVIKSATVQFLDYKGGQVAWVKLTKFGDRTKDEWLNVVTEINNKCVIASKNQCKGMVLDLRNNPGGYLNEAVDIAGEFLKPGQLVVAQQYGDGSREENKVNRNGQLLTMPVVVIVNEGSASAAEILTGALQDYKRAKVVGVKSFGKGSVQVPEDLPDGSGLHITVAKWLRPSGEWLDKKGIVPDIVVKWDVATPSAFWEDDPQLTKAINTL